jgi:hypothetical protein
LQFFEIFYAARIPFLLPDKKSEYNEASQQVMRRNAAKPGQGRERM